MEEIPLVFWQGIDQFNQREFYACHDTLEALWMEAQESSRGFYQGILQIAVGCYHLGNQNWRGAVILLGEGIRRLVPYQPEYARVDVARLIDESDRLLQHLQEAGPEDVGVWSRLVTDPEASQGFEVPSTSASNLPTGLPKVVLTFRP